VTISYIEHTRKLLREAPPPRKSLRTKEQLKISTARMLEEHGYHRLKVPDIAADAEVSEAAFYTYFRDKRDVVVTVLNEVMTFLTGLRSSVPRSSGSAFDAIRRVNLFWLQARAANQGVARCALEFADTDDEFAFIWRRYAREQVEWAVSGITRRYTEGAIEPGIVMIVAYGLASIMDEYIRLDASEHDPVYSRLRNDLAPTQEDLADLLSVIWYRVLYPGCAIEDELGDAARALWDLKMQAAPRRRRVQSRD